MALKNAFANLALDQSVMAATPLLKAINTTLLSTPYVYVVNEGSQQVWLATPGVINVNIANVSTPPPVQPISGTVNIGSTPIVSLANTQVAVQNFPATPIVQFVWPNPLNVYDRYISGTPINVNIANVSTPPSVQAISGTVNIGSTPIVSLANTQVTVQNFQATPIVQFIWPNPLFVYDKLISATPINVNIANVSTPPYIQNVNVINPSTPTATPIVIVVSQPPLSITFPASMNVNVANPSTPTATPIVNIASMPPITTTLAPGTQIWLATPQIVNVNIANVSTPPPVQVVSGTVNIGSTPIVSLANTQVAVQNWPAIQPISGTVSIGSTPIVSLANTQVTVQNWVATPIVQFIWPNPLFVYDKSISSTPLNVNIANVSTPPPVQVVSGTVNIGSTPIVSLANTQVAVQNFPATQNVKEISTPIVSLANTQVAVQNFPANQTISGTVSIGSTPIVSLANTQVTVQNFPSTPIVQFIWPNPLFVYDKLISATPLNVNIANPSTPPPVQVISGTVSIGSTPIVSLANTQVAVQNFPANQTISGTVSIGSTPIVSLANTQVTVQNFPATQNVKETSTPLVVLSGVGGSGVVNVNDIFDNATPTHRLETGQGRSLLFASIGATVSGDNIITPGIASNRIKVVSYVLMASDIVNVRWGSSTPQNAKSGVFPLIANTGVSAIGQASSHLFETNSGESLSLNLSAAVVVGGHVSYFVEP